MYGLSFNTHKNEKNREILDKLRTAIFVLKLDAQNQLRPNGYTPSDVQNQRISLSILLTDLETLIVFLLNATKKAEVDLSLASLANRFIQINPNDVNDRVDELKRLRNKIDSAANLSEWDFRLLDKLQSYLEEEVAESIHSMFRL